MRKHSLILSFTLMLVSNVFAQNHTNTLPQVVDTLSGEFHVYLCFGQSNMEGHAKIETKDLHDINERFKVMQAVDCPDNEFNKGDWRVAVPPMVRCHTGLSLADYFGRTMADRLPSTIQIGLINVSVGGCRIELFDKDACAQYIEESANWLKNMAKEYDNHPYQRLVELALLAKQQGGVIKGILLHQGESNSGEVQWPEKVKKIYDSLLTDLSLSPNSVPLLVGELVSESAGGACHGMNPIINTLPQIIENAHVISSEGCEAIGDHLHFSAAGYRELGKRYAETMLTLLIK